MKNCKQAGIVCGIGFLLLGIAACIESSAIKSTKVYFVVSRQEGSQVWQASTGKTDSYLIYEIVGSHRRPASTILPPDELALLNTFLFSITPTLTSDQVYLTPQIGKMSLSPDGRKLAWVATDIGCYTPASLECFGMEKLIVFDLSTKVDHVIWQTPLHQSGDLRLPMPGIQSAVWSPDSRYIAFAHGTDRGVPCLPRLRVVDIQTRSIHEVGIGGSLLAWSPDGTSLASIDCGVKGEVARIHSMKGDTTHEFHIEDIGVLGQTISWSRQSNQIVFTAISNADQARRAKLFAWDAKTGNIQGILSADNESYENAQWSPDGHWIAVDARAAVGDFYNKLLVIDHKSKAVVTQLTTERTDSSWQWSDDSKSILILLGNRTTQQSLSTFSIQNSSLTPIQISDLIAQDLPGQTITRPFFRSFTSIPQDNLILRIGQVNW